MGEYVGSRPEFSVVSVRAGRPCGHTTDGTRMARGTQYAPRCMALTTQTPIAFFKSQRTCIVHEHRLPGYACPHTNRAQLASASVSRSHYNNEAVGPKYSTSSGNQARLKTCSVVYSMIVVWHWVYAFKCHCNGQWWPSEEAPCFHGCWEAGTMPCF